MDLGLWPWHNSSNTVSPVQQPARHILTWFLNSPQNWKPSQCCRQPPTLLLILAPSLFSSSLPSEQLLMSSMAPSFSAIVWLHWLSWFTSYLSDYISINNHKSHTYPVSHGVPQASGLGAVLFILCKWFTLLHITNTSLPSFNLPSPIVTLVSPSSHTSTTSKHLSLKHLSSSSAETVIHVFIASRLDYCSSILYGLPSTVFPKITVYSELSCPVAHPLPLQRMH